MGESTTRPRTIIAMLLPALAYLDIATGLTDFSAWLLLLRLPLVFFAIGLLHHRKDGRPTKASDTIKIPLLSLGVSSAVTVGMGLFCWVILPSIIDLSLFGFLTPLAPAFEVWVNSGLVWFTAIAEGAQSLAYPLPLVFLLSSFTLLLWLPTALGAKTAEKIRQRGQITFTVPPPYPIYATEMPVTPPKITCHTQTTQQEPENQPETPKPLETFLATDGRDAALQARTNNLIALYKEVDRWNLYGRRRVYWMLTPQLAQKLLKLTADMMALTEFDEKEQPIVSDLLGKHWLKKMKAGDRTYVYGLDEETAQVLRRQMQRLPSGTRKEASASSACGV